jgi:DNA repair protein RadA/Sms
MSKNNTSYVCQDCGSVYKKWTGRCDDCGSWNSILEEKINSDFTITKARSNKLTFEPLSGIVQNDPRFSTAFEELNRVLGGGLVKGSAILIGGDPGIGKSTLLLQLVASLSSQALNCVYISGEESVTQIKLRASRLGVSEVPVKLLSATNVGDIIATIKNHPDIDVMIIDSIQTMFVKDLASAPGTVSQVRASAHEIIKLAKQQNIIVILVGHVTKDGQLAGPKVLEHMVDTVLYFEGERGHHFRILRAVKNRFGGVNEIGVFEMMDRGLAEVSNPSALFLSERDNNVSGTTIFAGIEGTRPILVEIQALISPSPIPMPRRSVVGWDLNRLAMIIAVLAVRYGLNLADKEVYLNVTGGMKIIEPAADLAVACALISAATNTPLHPKTIIFGEIGLSGEIRGVGHSLPRLKESIKLGFEQAITPSNSKLADNKQIQLHEIRHIMQLKDYFKK